MLRLKLFDYSDPYTVVRGTMDLLGTVANKNDKRDKDFAFKKYAKFRSCISNMNNTLIDNPEDLDIVMLMCKNLLE